MATIITILSLIPAIIKAITAIEEAIPMSGAGKAKTDMVLQIVQATGSGATELLPLVQKAIAIVVATLNAVGVFKQS
ncbi:MAG: hypothetical protein NTW42_07595 [Deltaproteobacteria bacterium]|nr:hypothetical protein [Deltaproteobacteria bacterium]